MSRTPNHKLCIASAILMLVLLCAVASFAETITYSYDNLQRLTRVEYSNGTVVEYVYDNADNRLQESTVEGPPYSVSGRILKDGVGFGGVLVDMTGYAYSETLVTGPNGDYLFPDVPQAAYTITPSKTYYVFDPLERVATVSGADLDGQDFTAALRDTDGDGVFDISDNCPTAPNADQLDCNSNGVGDACDPINPTADDSNCDGIDNDCDGVADDAYVPTPTACGVGECVSTGQMLCSGGTLHDTCVPGSPTGPDDNCDGLDQDCDAVADDNYVSTPTSCGIGECESVGELVCINGTVQDTCVGGSPSAEMCDGLDNDCDGSVADDGVDEAWFNQSTTCGVGECESAGILICEAGVQADTCEPGTPNPEVCDDTLDNDCDGLTDCDDPDCNGISPCPTARSATFYIIKEAKEDTYARTGGANLNDYKNSYGWHYLGYASGSYYNDYWRWALDDGHSGGTDGIAIPKGATITNAYVRIRSDYNNSNALTAAFQALVPDDKWEAFEGFSTINYADGVSLNNIPRQGTPVTWEITDAWTNGTVYASPYITQLLQARIDNADYDPSNYENKYFGLVLYRVSGSYYRTGTQEPDTAATAELYVEWEEFSQPQYEEATFHIANNPAEDTYARTSTGSNLNDYNNSNGWHYFGYYLSSTYNAYWRWALDNGQQGGTGGIAIPQGAIIKEAYVRIRSDYTNGGALTAAFQALVTDDKWETLHGFDTVNYANGTSLNSIPRQGTPVTWGFADSWTTDAVYASPEITDLLQARVDNADYDPTDSENKYFGLVLYWVSGSYYRTGTQEPDNDAYTAELHVKWENP